MKFLRQPSRSTLTGVLFAAVVSRRNRNQTEKAKFHNHYGCLSETSRCEHFPPHAPVLTDERWCMQETRLPATEATGIAATHERNDPHRLLLSFQNGDVFGNAAGA